MMISSYPSKKEKLAEMLKNDASAEDICAALGITYPTLEKWVAMLVQDEKDFFPLPPDLSHVLKVSSNNQISINNTIVAKLGLPNKPGDKLKIETAADAAGGYTITLRKVS